VPPGTASLFLVCAEVLIDSVRRMPGKETGAAHPSAVP
jgi:hypothetical protein